MCTNQTDPDGRPYVKLCRSFSQLAGARIYYDSDQGAPVDPAGCWDKSSASLVIGQLVTEQISGGGLAVRFDYFFRRTE